MSNEITEIVTIDKDLIIDGHLLKAGERILFKHDTGEIKLEDKGFCPELPKDTSRNICKSCGKAFHECFKIKLSAPCNNGWTKCTSDTMPDTGRLVLMCVGATKNMLLGFYAGEWYIGDFHNHMKVELPVNFWIELPSPPEDL